MRAIVLVLDTKAAHTAAMEMLSKSGFSTTTQIEAVPAGVARDAIAKAKKAQEAKAKAEAKAARKVARKLGLARTREAVKEGKRVRQEAKKAKKADKGVAKPTHPASISDARLAC